MAYILNNLGSYNFEKLVQSLCLKILGEGVKVYGNGPDGQREATFDGKSNYPSKESSWSGYFVVQAKFKDASTKTGDFTWLSKQFRAEMAGFEKKKKKGARIPDNYLFFTNVVLTPKESTGVKDKMDALADSYKSLIPNIAILGNNEICAYLDSNRDIATSYASFILSGDILSLLYDTVSRAQSNKRDALFRYIAQSFNDDYCSRMEQAGQVTEERVSIDKIFIDLKMSSKTEEESTSFIKNSILQGDKCWRNSNDDISSSGSPASLKLFNKEEDYNSNKFVIKGSAGQGKSTVCQFLAQIYRANFLSNFTSLANDKIIDFLNRIKTEDMPSPTCFRIPIRIELRLYSAWIIEQQKKRENFDVITFISKDIAKKSAADFDCDTLRYYLEKYSFIFFFDGLDEVSENSNRKDVMNEIDSFITIELKQRNTDSMFIATTRPEGYVGEFNKNEFTHVNLLNLSKEDCLSYIKKLLDAIENDIYKKENYLSILESALNNNQISFMMQTPLQTTIMAILVRAGGEPPRDKFSLFKDYFDIIIKREKQKSVGAILNENEELIVNIYYLLGYELQKRSYTSERSDALISLSEFKELIELQLARDGINKTDSGYKKLLEGVYDTVVKRINFASEIQAEKIGFSIRSMQEFLAAVYFVKNFSDVKLKELIIKLAKSAYWKNTFMFILEGIAKDKQYYVDMIIDTVLSELNGSNVSVNEFSACANIYWGSQIAFEILTSNIFKNKPKYENKLCKYVKLFCTLQPDERYNNICFMSDNVKKELCNMILAVQEADLSNGIYALAMHLSLHKPYYEILKSFIHAHAIEIATHYYRYSGSYHDCPFQDALDIALENGYEPEGSLVDLAYLSTRLSKLNIVAQKAIFAAVVKSVIWTDRHHPDVKSVKMLSTNFGCNFNILLRDFEGRNRHTVSDANLMNIYYQMPQYNQAEIDKIIKIADKFGFKGFSLVLKTICSKNIEDYRNFCANFKIIEKEIAALDLYGLLYENAVCLYIYRNVNEIGEEAVIKRLDDTLAVRINNLPKIHNLNEFFVEECNDISLIGFFLSESKNIYKQIFVPLQNLYRKEQVKKHNNLSGLVSSIFMWLNYPDNDKFCAKIFPEIVEYINVSNLSQYSVLGIIQFMLDTMPESYYAKFADVTLSYTPSVQKTNFRHFLNRNENSKYDIEWLQKWVRFLEVTGNNSVYNFLVHDLIDLADYETVKQINWLNLINYNKNHSLILAELCFDADVDKIKSLLVSPDDYNFLLKVICSFKVKETTKINYNLLQLYAILLNHFKGANSLDNVYYCEKRIGEIIATSHIDI